MKLKTPTFWSIALCIVSLGLANSLMAAEPPPSPIVMETFACSYKDGKDWGDKAKARDYLVAQMDKAGLSKTRAIHWTQKKGMAPVDTVWFDIHESFPAFTAASDAWDASGIGPAVNAQFDKVEDCTPGLSVVRPIHAREGSAAGDDSALIINLACTLNEGVGQDGMADLSRHMGAAMAGFGEDAPYFAAVREPITSGPNYPDLFIFSVFDDMTHWGKYVGQLFGSEAGQSVRNHMDMIVDCDLSMWDSQMVIAPDGE